MDKFKFILFSIIIIIVLGLIGYWSFTSLQSGSEYVKDDKIKQLEKENEDLTKEVERLVSELSILQPVIEEEPAPVVDNTPESTISKYQDLVDALQKLVVGNIFLKEGSKGASVGTVQNFLNIYNNTSDKIDNDYGPGMKKTILAFQRDFGLTADGEAGKNTFNKMIDWLKKQ